MTFEHSSFADSKPPLISDTKVRPILVSMTAQRNYINNRNEGFDASIAT